MNPAAITINKHTTLPWCPYLTVAQVLSAMNYTFPHIIVTINGILVRHDTYGDTLVPPKADVRVVHLIAGG